MNRSMPGLPVYHQLPEFTQTHVHRVSDAIQPSHPLSSPSPPAPNPSAPFWRFAVQFSRSLTSNSLQPHGLQHSRHSYPWPTPGACSNTCPSSWWCHPTISSSVILVVQNSSGSSSVVLVVQKITESIYCKSFSYLSVPTTQFSSININLLCIYI